MRLGYDVRALEELAGAVAISGIMRVDCSTGAQIRASYSHHVCECVHAYDDRVVVVVDLNNKISMVRNHNFRVIQTHTMVVARRRTRRCIMMMMMRTHGWRLSVVGGFGGARCANH